jgi:hypothetical protein
MPYCRSILAVGCGCLLTLAAGCTSARSSADLAGPPSVGLNPGLVTPARGWTEYAGASWRSGPEDWASARNDGLMGESRDLTGVVEQRVELRRREYLWTVNGRPRESTYTRTTTVRRRNIR